MEGNADLVQRVRPQQGIPLPGEQGAVGHQAHPKAQLPGYGQQLRQLRVQQRFPQHMEVEIVRLSPELLRQGAELRRSHSARQAAGTGAEITGEIAAIGDLDIDAAAHRPVPSPEFFAGFILSYFRADEKRKDAGLGGGLAHSKGVH